MRTFGASFVCMALAVLPASVTSVISVTSAASARADIELTVEVVTDAVDAPVWLTHAPGDADRLFILERDGAVRIVRDGALLETPFIDISGSVSTSGEGGLLGLAFHPGYAANGRFFVSYTAPAAEGFQQFSIVAEHVADVPGADVASSTPVRTLLRVGQPQSVHNGGWIGFGPNDGFLYVALGDGSFGGLGRARAQDITDELLGKILRLDVDGDDFPADPDRNYSVPPTNPFVGVAGDDEIWAYGLRNPWRCAFDRATGDLYIADVGEESIEEVNVQPAAGAGGENYGWGCMEGTQCTGEPVCTCGDPSLVPPAYEYAHPGNGCAISGGTVYRGAAIPALDGAYFFGDFCFGKIWTIRVEAGCDGNVTSDLREWTSQLSPDGPPFVWNVVAFGEDLDGELYICHLGGAVVKIVPAPPSAPADLDHDGDIDFQDLLLMLTAWGPCAACPEDLDGSGSVDFQDLLTLLVGWG